MDFPVTLLAILNTTMFGLPVVLLGTLPIHSLLAHIALVPNEPSLGTTWTLLVDFPVAI